MRLKTLSFPHETTITVASELYVAANNLSTAMLDVKTGDGYYSTPRLRVDYAKRTLPLQDIPVDEDVGSFDPEVREGVVPFPLEPFFFGR